MSRIFPATPAGRWLAVVATLSGGGVACGQALGGDWWVATMVASLTVAVVGLLLRRGVVVLGAVCGIAAALGLARGAQAVPPHLEGRVQTPLVLQGTVRDQPAAHRGETVVIVDVDRVAPAVPGLTSAAFAIPGRSTLLPGDRVRVEATALHPPDLRPGPLSAAVLDRGRVDAVATSPRVTLLDSGGPSPGRLAALARERLAGAVDGAVAEPVATLTAGIAFGMHRPLPASVDADLRDAGLVHLVATSGLKVALVAAMLARVLAIGAAGPRARRVVTIALVGLYVVVAGGGAAASRSAAMGSVTLGLGGTGRRVDSPVLLSVVGAALLLIDPGLTGDAGFQLSILGTAGILALAGPLAERIRGPRLLVEPFAVTCAAQIATLPVSAATFGTVSLVGPVANALVLPAVPLVMGLAALGAAGHVIVPGLGTPFLLAAGMVSAAILTVAHVAALMPAAALHPPAWPVGWTLAEVAAAAAGLALWAARRHAGGLEPPGPARWRPSPGARTRGAGMALVGLATAAIVVATGVALAAARPDGRLHVSVLAAGAGSAVLLRTGDGGLLLADAGDDPAQLLSSLGRSLPPATHTIDVLLLSGGARTAVGGLADLATHYAVGRVLVPAAELGTAARAAVLALRGAGSAVDVLPVGVSWSWSGASFRCVGAGAPPPNGPLRSVCAVQVADAGTRVLLLGDLAPPDQDVLAGSWGDGLRSDLVVTPPGGLMAPALVRVAHPIAVAVPGTRTSRRPTPAALAGAELRLVSADGTLSFVGRGGGGVEDA